MNTESKKIIAILASCLTVCTAMSGCVFLPDEEEVLAAPSVAAADVTYTTITAEKRDLVKKDINTGTICSALEYNTSFKEQSGTITKINVRAGDVVKEGDIICELDTSDLDYSITEMELNLKRAKLDKKILQEQGASQAEIDRAQVDIDLLQIQMDDLYAKQDDAKLYAKVSGTISSLGEGISAGNYVEAGQTVATIIDTDDLYLAFTPSDFTLYKMDTKLSIEIDDEEYPAEVLMIPSEVIAKDYEEDEEVDYDILDKNEDEVIPEEIVYNLEYVYVKFSETPPENCVGNLVDAVLVIDERKDAIVISNNLIKSIDGRDIVYLYKDGKKTAQEVEIGLQTGSLSEIVSGIEEGDEVIVR